MPDIDPAALSRPSITLSTPTLKSITVSAPTTQKVPKTSQIIPARIDLEPLYTALKSAIGNEQWNTYKESTTQFILGRLNQVEYSERIDPILFSANGDKSHLHNQLLAAIYGNLTREMPDQGVVAPWVSANDKPTTNVGTKPVTGDAAERRLKGEVMQLPSRDRRRIKELAQNDFDPFESMANMFTEHHRGRATRVPDIPQSANNDLNKMNWDLEIRKRFTQPLAVESGEFPDITSIESRMLPICYETGLVNGHGSDAAQFMTVAAETYIKEFLSTVFSRTRSNGPGDSGSTGFGSGTAWIQTHKYRQQLKREEAAFSRGELTRDKSGLLPVEAKAASERAPLGMADLRLALEIGDCGIGTFPIIKKSVIYTYRDGELEHYDNYTWLDGRKPIDYGDSGTDTINGTGSGVRALTNGGIYPEPMDIDEEPATWEGTSPQDLSMLDSILDSCLAVP
ncbi:transcriptional regulator of RNA polII, SAGA, subunit-domain-containing protein [Annulohypoxylon maeteangense]|uniref:transcriptional regulator of RNA polII, SAGA, subunit-domain-containing protein n=1 Tax=Annulohypoxylon maeteangense TaxID=1927788 RepID=UPI002008E091|nr:transcriptional regulator of RNA polII, SAGA, subunit-domain-containing protein [Annulohypoxylon maeteangense]KAI0885500.1 transcriptional regulator of RNA polII, SAGA, subunit-domain-containing protein [Annulohypoxylon maeteangense]